MNRKLIYSGKLLNLSKSFFSQFTCNESPTQICEVTRVKFLSELLMPSINGILSMGRLNLALLSLMLLMFQFSFSQGELIRSRSNFRIGIGGTFGSPLEKNLHTQSESYGAAILLEWDAFNLNRFGSINLGLNVGFGRRIPYEIDLFCRLNPGLCPFCFTGLSCPPELDLPRNNEWLITPGISWTLPFLQSNRLDVRIFGRGGVQYKEEFEVTTSFPEVLNGNQNVALGVDIESRVKDAISPVISYGLGINFRLTERIGLFVEARNDRFFDRDLERSIQSPINGSWGDPYPHPSTPGTKRSYLTTFGGINISL